MISFDSTNNIRKYFPFFAQEEKYHYLDSGATSLKLQTVIDATVNYYQNLSSSVHRGAYSLSDRVTDQYENVRHQAMKLMGAKSPEEIIFTSGNTESCNLVAKSLGELCLKEGDEIVVTAMEHHANFVPWQVVAKKHKAHFKVIPLTKDHKVDLEAAKKIINPKTKIVAFAHISNVLGFINPVKELINLAKEQGAYTLIDGAQYIPHFNINVSELDCDFYTFSPHKVFGPTGVGILYGRKKVLDKMPPHNLGGHMIFKVTEKESTWNVLPNKFEAGTPNIAGVIGMGAALDFLQKLDRNSFYKHEMKLAKLLTTELSKRKNFTIHSHVGEGGIGLVSFSHKSIHPHDVAFIADSHKVCLRSGHMCAQPLLNILGVPALTRACLNIYNDENDVDQFLKAMTTLEATFS